MNAYVIEKVKELIAAPSCCAEAKAAAQPWLDALGTEHEAEESAKLIKELEEDIEPIDALVSFAESDVAEKVFGDGVAAFRTHAKELKESGAKYCDCPACAACAAILEHKAEL